MTNKVVVTGGAGFIGSHLVDTLVEQGNEVHVIDNLSHGDVNRIPNNVELYTLDVSDQNAVIECAKSIGNIDRWYHLAAQIDVRVSVDDPIFDAQVNVLGTISVLKAAELHRAPIVFFSSGGAIYGEATPPTSEQADWIPLAPYGASKLAAEEYVAQHSRLTGIPHSIIRPANVYGPRQDPLGEGGVVAIFGKCAIDEKPARIYGDGKQTRDFVYVKDIVDTAIAAADTAMSKQDLSLRVNGACPRYNVSTGVETSVLELWDTMQAAVGTAIDVNFEPAKEGEIRRSTLDATLAKEVLGVRIDTSLKDGVASTLAWLGALVPK